MALSKGQKWGWAAAIGFWVWITLAFISPAITIGLTACAMMGLFILGVSFMIYNCVESQVDGKGPFK